MQTNMSRYIADLPIESFKSVAKAQKGPLHPVDPEKLPDVIVNGSNMIEFPDSVPADIRLSVALSLLAAQRVAANDSVILTPQQWVERHNTVLTNLTWLGGAVETVNLEFDDLNVAVHKAIIPFLTAAFGPFAAAGALILTALKQLQEMDKDSPWITLFDRQSRHFDATMHQFSVVQVKDKHLNLRIASARFDAWSQTTQVLFVKVRDVQTQFASAGQTFSAEAELLADMNQALRKKLIPIAEILIDAIPANVFTDKKLRAVA